ncbi:hypothetical protein [Nocardioides sp. SYSU D00038]|uniref:hypothetical protein n=1 Tax=Nocardioides sp. SYSU D00038 TaxID=2812554 RepID=UPI0019681025|nr:hypothetical protein [Nocardioides sp. SYSU D00038]
MVVPLVVERRVVLPRPAAQVWARVTTPEGIADELRPVLVMTVPPGLRGRSIAEGDALVGRPLGRAWLLLLGVLPVEYDAMTLVSVGARSFHERSTMLSLRRWEHERSVVEVDAARCEVVDRLTLEPRWAPLGAVACRVVGALFSHRHRRLVRWTDQPTGQPVGH